MTIPPVTAHGNVRRVRKLAATSRAITSTHSTAMTRNVSVSDCSESELSLSAPTRAPSCSRQIRSLLADASFLPCITIFESLSQCTVQYRSVTHQSEKDQLMEGQY